MDVALKNRKSKIGLFFISCRRFIELGKDTIDGSYLQRIKKETAYIKNTMCEQVDIIDPGEIFNDNDMKRALNLFKTESVDCILCLFHSWSEDNVWIKFLRDSDPNIELIYFYPAKDSISYADCSDDNDFMQFLTDGGLVGSLVGSGSIRKFNRDAKIIVGTIDDVFEEIVEYANLCKIKNILKDSHLCVVPTFNEIMWNTYFNPYRIFQSGPEISFYSYQELKDISEAIDEKEILIYQNELKQKYEMIETVEDEKFKASVRYSLGLDKLMDRYDLDGMTFNDVSTELFESIGLRPGFYPNAINEKLRFVCPEGDLGIALGIYILKLLTKKQVNVIEPFYIDKSRNIFCAGHAGPNDYNDEKSINNVKISIDKRFAKTNYKYAGAPFAWLRIPPGEMTMLHISQIKDEIKVVATKVKSINGPHRIQGYSHSEFQVDEDINFFFEKILKIGTTQHFVVVEGDYIKQLDILSKLCNFNFYTV